MSSVTDSIRIESRDVKWLKEQSDNGLLEIDDSFQRQYIWTSKNQIRLIETILLGYSIPEIYLWEHKTDGDTGETVLSIIDGQQRLGSIFDFINGKFDLKKTYLDFKESDYVNKKFTDLTPDQKSQIWKYPLSVRFIKDNIQQGDIVNMFLRLNSTSTTLNPQELRNAEYNGLFIRLANELTELDIWENLNLFTGNDYRRMKDLEFISSLLIFIRLGIDEETSQKNINKVYDTFNEEYEEFEDDRSLFITLIEMIRQFIFSDSKVKIFISKKVHFYTLFTCVYFLHKKFGGVSKANLDNYFEFVNEYGNKKSSTSGKFRNEIDEYFTLSQEGTQRKGNRLRRFELIRDVLLK